MTLLEIVRETHVGLGEPSDLEYRDVNDNLDTASLGWSDYLLMVNTACTELATWKFPSGRQLRFRSLEGDAYFSSDVIEGLVTAHTAGTNLLTAELPVEIDDYYSGRVVTLSGVNYRILMSQTSGIETQLMLLTAPVVTALGVYAIVSKREYRFTNDLRTFGVLPTDMYVNYTSGRPLEVSGVFDVDSGVELTILGKNESGLETAAVLGTPNAYYKKSGGLRFDVWPEAERSYAVRYYRTPKQLGLLDASVEPEIPVNFHKALVLHCLWQGYRRMQESTNAYSTKQDLSDKLAQMKTEYDFADDAKDNQVFMNVAGRY